MTNLDKLINQRSDERMEKLKKEREFLESKALKMHEKVKKYKKDGTLNFWVYFPCEEGFYQENFTLCDKGILNRDDKPLCVEALRIVIKHLEKHL
jgi:hypothetical protein